jgi:hypothetical protein
MPVGQMLRCIGSLADLLVYPAPYIQAPHQYSVSKHYIDCMV